MHNSVLSDEYYLPEHIVWAVVEKAKQLYKSKTSRLDYCAMRLGKDNISQAETFYSHYFEGKENVSK